MLDSKSKQILSFLKPYALEHNSLSITADTINENIPSLNINEIKNALNYLRDNDYLKLSKYIGDIYVVMNVTHKGTNFEEFEPQPIPSSQTFNITSVNNSAFGNNGNTTINNGYSFDEIRSLISSKPIEDQEELNKLVNTVEIITENGETISKGFLSKFSDLLAKHSDIAIALGTGVMNWLTGK